MVRIAWDQLTGAGLEQGMDLAFLRRADDDEKGAGYILDAIGRTWGPRLVLGAGSEVVIVDSPADISAGAMAFGFDGWSLEYLGVRRNSPPTLD